MEEQIRRRELEADNARLKRMYADLALENAAIKDVLAKNLTPSAKRQVVSAMVTEHRLPVTRVCRSAGLSQAAYGRRLRQPKLGAGFHARRALRRPAVPHPQRDRRGQPRGAGDPGGAVSARLDAHPDDGPAGRLVRRTEVHPHGQRTGDDPPRIRRVGAAPRHRAELHRARRAQPERLRRALQPHLPHRSARRPAVQLHRTGPGHRRRLADPVQRIPTA